MLLTIGCLVLLIISWAVVIGSKSNSEKQMELISQAKVYIEDKVYILAIPLLEEANQYHAKYTLEAEEELKKSYLAMINQRGYRRKYINLLEKQMNRKGAASEVFIEAAQFYMDSSKLSEALIIMKKGIVKTEDEELTKMYEENRYSYKMGNSIYDNVTDIYEATIGVQTGGLWGIAKSNGVLQIPCEYEKISTYSEDRAIVQKDEEIYAVDKENNRLALLKEKIFDFGNYANGRVTLLTKEGWKRASGEFEIGNILFEEIGTYSDGYAAAKQNGKWGVIDLSSDWLIPAENDSIIMDELGCCYAQGAVFVKNGEYVSLFIDGKQVEGAYEDAKPFNKEGYAAVKKNGKWGFINLLGEKMIDFQFEDAFSFGQHLAAVKVGEFWGYINLEGEIVIEPLFLEAKKFGNGSAPVLTERGWQFITLVEYGEGVRL